MCRVVYLASTAELPLIPWREESRGFHTEPLEERDSVVRAQFTLPNVVYAGSHLGCGCGFAFEQDVDDSDDAEEVAYRKGTRHGFAAYVAAILASGAPLEVFTCWAGDEGREVVARREVPLSAVEKVFDMQEGEVVALVREEGGVASAARSG